MAGLGTVANVSAILVAGVLGTFFGDLLKEKLQDGLLKATSICVIFIGIAGAMEQMLKISEGHLASNGSMMMVCCFIVGTLIGEIIDIEDKLERLGSWLKVKSKSEGDGGFVDAVCDFIKNKAPVFFCVHKALVPQFLKILRHFDLL